MTDDADTAAARLRLLITALAAGNFAIGMGAFVVIAVLSPIADDLGMSKAEAGMVMTVYAVAYAILSPLLVALTGFARRRSVLVAGMAIFLVAALVAMVSDNAAMLFAARVAGALGAGLFTPVAASVAISTSTPERRGKALSAVFFGMTLSQALGMPVGSFVGYTFGWQAVFGVVAALAAGSLALVLAAMPRQVAFEANTLATLGAALADWRSMLSVLVTATFTASAYVLYTYVAPLLEQDMGFGRDGVTLTLVVYGAGAVAGNWLAGMMTDRFGPKATLVLVAVSQIALMPVFSFLPVPLAVLGIVTFLWSTSGWSFMVPQQARLVRQTPDRQAVVLSLNAAGIYVGASLGSAIGGQVIETAGLAWLGIVGAACWAASLLHLLLSEQVARR